MAKHSANARIPEPVIIWPARSVRTLKPPPGIGEPIVPANYYITSGEAVAKGKQLVKEIAEHRDLILQYPPTRELDKHGREVSVALAEAMAFVAELLLLRRGWLWLECERDGESVVGRCKTSRTVPRPR